MTATAQPRLFNSGTSREIKRVLPLPERPIKENTFIRGFQNADFYFSAKKG